jgi:hypothetical protein
LLNDALLHALRRVWDKHGEKALERMAEEHPSQFVANMFKLLPKEVKADTDNTPEPGDRANSQ